MLELPIKQWMYCYALLSNYPHRNNILKNLKIFLMLYHSVQYTYTYNRLSRFHDYIITTIIIIL